MQVALKETIDRLSAPYRARVEGPRTRALAFLVAAFGVAGLLVARSGTGRTRIAAVALLAAGMAIAGVVRWYDRRVERSPARVLRRLAARAEPLLVSRAVRALRLVDARTDGTSPDLASHFLARRLGEIPVEAAVASATRARRILVGASVILLAGIASACVSGPWRVVEGADVLLARRGKAPVPLAYLADLQMSARPPDYLHQEARAHPVHAEVELPVGTLLSVRGRPIHEGRRLALSDGVREIPFVDDGSGGVVARWPILATAELRVVARFGDVVIEEADPSSVTAIPDREPEVTLEDAPRTVALVADATVAEIPIRYEAVDDHGLREIHLVLRSGAREERRVLSKLNGETQRERGGYSLRVSDPFIQKSHAPVEIRVEARDNDAVSGPKWGKSVAITVIPPRVGEPEALRMAALRKLRDRLTDSLAARMSKEVPPRDPERRTFTTETWRGIEEDREHLRAVTATSYAGARVPPRLAALLDGQMRKIEAAGLAVVRAPSPATHEGVVKASEQMLLVTDAALAGLGSKDTRTAALALSEVADDLAAGALEAEKAAATAAADTRMDAAKVVLEGGAASMRQLGWLGHDLGEIVTVYLARVGRGRAARDFFHAELAARDLAARLRQPDPSFGAKGSSGTGRGTESGGGSDAGNEEPSPAEQAFDEAARDLERLAADHAGQMGKLDQALSVPPTAEETRRFSDEARRHAALVREATAPMPSVGAGSDSWTSKGAAAKEHAEQMARSLEQGSPADAVTNGKSALGSLDEARRQAARDRWTSGDAERRIEDTRRKLEGEVAWAERQLADMKKRAEERAHPELARQAAGEKKLADRAKALAERKDKDALPDRAAAALDAAEKAAREAARAMQRGDGERARVEQREAQQRLESAREALGKEAAEEGPRDGDHGVPSGHTDIPKADAHKGPEEFRQRVMKGLGSGDAGRYRDAVRRYAEGLLR